MRHRTIRGEISYTSKKPERLDQVRGREYFTFTVHADGKRTLRAHCEIEEPAPTVLRDVIYAIDEHDKPMDCYVRLTIGDSFMGSGWFRMGAHEIECESYGPSIGRVSQRMPVVGEYDGFGTHPIVADAYITKRIDHARGPHKRDFRSFLPSPDHRGATPPLIAESTIQLAFIGFDTITVAAGTFAARHFCFTDERGGMATDKGAHPEYHLWVTDDADAIFLQGGVGGYMQTWYELVALERA
jgi:hypothetical protein